MAPERRSRTVHPSNAPSIRDWKEYAMKKFSRYTTLLVGGNRAVL
jgi:hypothetical protein